MLVIVAISIATAWPLWLAFFCLLLGTGFGWILYFTKASESILNPKQRKMLACLRALAVSLIAFFLLSPLLKYVQHTIEKPILVILEDQSESMVATKSLRTQTSENYLQVAKLPELLAKKFEVIRHPFSNGLLSVSTDSIAGKKTDIAGALQQIQQQYEGRNVAAIVLATDGNYNVGSNPLYAINDLTIPIYPIAMGDTTLFSDAFFAAVNHNKKVMLGNSMDLQIVVAANGLPNQDLEIKLMSNNATVDTRRIKTAGTKFIGEFNFVIPGKDKGLKHYTVEIASVKGESNLLNNKREVYFEVVEEQYKILILAAGPHPDIAAIKAPLTTSGNYQVNTIMARDFDNAKVDADLIILHELPSYNNQLNNISTFNDSKAALWYILGGGSNVGQLPKSIIQIEGTANKVNQVLPSVVPTFSYFSLSEVAFSRINQMPPFTAPFGSYQTKVRSESILTQKINGIQTNYPLWMLADDNGHKLALTAGEGIWLWRMNEIAQFENSTLTDELILKTVQYLLTNEQQKRFTILNATTFEEDETPHFEAQLYDKSMALTVVPEVLISIMDESGVAYPYAFNKLSNTYSLSTQKLPPGNYSFIAQTQLGQEAFKQKGQFTVKAIQSETSNPVANHQILQQMAIQSGATLFYPNQIKALSDTLVENNNFTPLSIQTDELLPLINIKAIFFIIIALLSIEWFVRKRSGAY